MAKNDIKKISVNALERITNDEELYTTFNWEGEEVVVKKRLDLVEVLSMVDGVANGCFTDDKHYSPEVRQFTMDCAILEFYSNFRLPENVEKRYAIVCSTAVQNAINSIVSHIDIRQFKMIEDAITEKIDYTINTQTVSVERRIMELSAQIEEVGKNITGIFNDMSQEEISGLISSLANGVDEEKLVDAIVKARYDVAQDNTVSDAAPQDNVIDFNTARADGDGQE